MQSDWTNNDNDWQLKKLQHDSLKTAEKVVEVMRETIEKEVLAQGKDYERLFGIRSAQFTEYLTMVAQKLEQDGVQHSDVINWLNSAASTGSVPADYASDLRDSQSKTVPFIPGGPMHDFGEQSLLDRSLGNQGVASPRPGGPVSGNGHGGDANNGHGYAPPNAPASSYASPTSFASPPSYAPAPPMPIPQHTPVSMPLQQAMPTQAQAAVPMQIPMPMQQTASAYQSSLPPHTPMPSTHARPQPNFNQPTSFAQAAPAVPAPPAPPAPQTTAQPTMPNQPNQFAQAPGARREDDDKYVFDPFTAWD